MRSIRGRGKLSFGQDLLMSVKSMQSRHLPFTFFTRTMLANHSGYSTSLIAFAWRSLLTSSLITFYLSGAKLLLFSLTGLKEGLTFNLWVITAGSTDRPKTWCVKSTPMCASARVAPSNIMYQWYGYRYTGIDVLTTEIFFSNIIWIYVLCERVLVSECKLNKLV